MMPASALAAAASDLQDCASKVVAEIVSHRQVSLSALGCSQSEQDMSLRQDFGVSESTTGWLLYDPLSQRSLSGHACDEAFVPASIVKLATMLAALETLGPDHRFTTEVHLSGEVRDGQLQGDLFLVGGGDPTLTSPRLMALAEAVQRRGIRKVAVGCHYDSSSLPALPCIDPAQSTADPGNPPISALAVERNDVTADPARHAAELFHRFARQSGISLPPPEPRRLPAGSTLLATSTSNPLLAIAEHALVTSDNLTAELVLLAVVHALGGRPASLETAAGTLLAWWRDRLPAARWTDVRLVNGSGATDRSRLTPRLVVEMLETAVGRSYAERTFASLLASAAHRGTLATRFTSPDTALAVWGKTGTMDFVSNLAGEVRTASGRRLLFAVLASDIERRRGADRSAAPTWQRLVRSFTDALVTRWCRLSDREIDS